MKPKWETAIFNAVALGKRFQHNDDCRGITGGQCRRSCSAGPANKALDEIAEGLKTGIPVTRDKK